MKLKNTNPSAPHTHTCTHTIFALLAASKHIKEHKECKEMTKVQMSKQTIKNNYQSDFLLSATWQITRQSAIPEKPAKQDPCNFSMWFKKWNLVSLPSPFRQQTIRTRNFLFSEWFWQAKWSLLHELSQFPYNYKSKALRLLVFCSRS